MKNRTRFLPLALAIFGLTLAGPAWSDLGLNMTPGVTAMSREIYDLHMLILWVCVVIAVGVYAAMVYAIVKFRKSKGAQPAKFTHSYTVEVIWTVIPAIILIVMAIPAARTLIKMEDTRGVAADGQGHGLPVALAVRLHRRRRAVLQHAEARQQRGSQEGLRHRSEDRRELPARRRQSARRARQHQGPAARDRGRRAAFVVDAGVRRQEGRHSRASSTRPGSRRDTEGTYRGQCAELCGMDHGFMPIVVRVTSRAEYDDWLKTQRAQVSSLTQ